MWRAAQRAGNALFSLPGRLLRLRPGESLRNRPFLRWLIAFCAGLAAGELGWTIPPLAALFTSLLFFSARFPLRWHWLFLCLGLLRYDVANLSPYEPAPSIPSPALLRAVGLPEPTRSGHRVWCVVEQEGYPTARVLVYFRESISILPEYGSKFELFARWQPPQTGRDSRFDWAAYLRRKGVRWVAYVNTSSEFQMRAPPAQGYVAWMAGLRRSLRDLSERDFSYEDRAMVEGLVVGAASDFPQELRDSFARSGMAHLLAASGMHLVLIVFLLNVILTRVSTPFYARLGLLLLFVWFYALLAGWQPPIVRAAVMTTFYFLAPVWNREADGLSALGWAAFLWLLYEPGALWEVGFQFSFATVLFLLLFFQRVNCPVNSYLTGLSQNRVLSYTGRQASAILSASFVAQAAASPIQIAHFGYLPLWSLVANLLAVPVASLMTPLGFFYWISQGVGAVPLAWGCAFLKWTALTLGDPTDVLTITDISPVYVLAFYAAVLSIAPEPRSDTHDSSN